MSIVKHDAQRARRRRTRRGDRDHAGRGRPARLGAKCATAAGAISIDNFTFTPQRLTVKAGTTVTWTNKDDIPHGIASENNAFARSKALDTDDSLLVHLYHAGHLPLLLLPSSAHDRHDRGRSGDGGNAAQ